MINECEKFEEIESPINIQNPSILKILAELNRLQLENDVLKADKKDLLRKNLQLRNDNEILHNRLNEKLEKVIDIGMLNEYEKSYYCGCESEEELDMYIEKLNNCSVKR